MCLCIDKSHEHAKGLCTVAISVPFANMAARPTRRPIDKDGVRDGEREGRRKTRSVRTGRGGGSGRFITCTVAAPHGRGNRGEHRVTNSCNVAWRALGSAPRWQARHRRRGVSSGNAAPHSVTGCPTRPDSAMRTKRAEAADRRTFGCRPVARPGRTPRSAFGPRCGEERSGALRRRRCA